MIKRALVGILIALPSILLSSCEQISANARRAVYVQYMPYSWTETVDFIAPLRLPGGAQLTYASVNPPGYSGWYKYKLCSVDVAGSELTEFTFNPQNVVVEWDGREFRDIIIDSSVFYGGPPQYRTAFFDYIRANLLAAGPRTFPKGLTTLPSGPRQTDLFLIVKHVEGRPWAPPRASSMKLRYEGHPVVMMDRESC